MSEFMPVKFGAVVQSSDPKGLPAGSLVLAENCVMDKPRRLGKRLGTSTIDRAVSLSVDSAGLYPLTTGKRLSSRGPDIAVHNGEHVYQRVNNEYVPIGRTTPFKATRRGLVDNARSAAAVDFCILGDRLIKVVISGYSPTTGSILFLSIENVHTGIKEFPPFFVGYTQYARVHVMPGMGPNGLDTILVVYGENGTGRMLCYMFTPGYGSHGTFVLNLNPNDGQQSASAGMVCDSAFQVTDVASGSLKMLYVGYALNAPVGGVYVRFAGFMVDPIASTVTIVDGDYPYLGVAGGVHTIGVACHPTHGAAMVWSGADSNTRCATYDVEGANTGVIAYVDNSGWCQNVFVMFHQHPGTGVWGLLVGRVRGNQAQALHQSFQTSFMSPLSTLDEEYQTARTTYHVQGVSRPWAVGNRLFCAATLFPRELSLLSTATITAASTVVLEIEGIQFPQFGGTEIDSGYTSPHLHAATLENQTGWIPHNKYYVTPSAVHADGQIYVAGAYRNLEPTNIQKIPVGWNLHRLDPIELGDTHRMVTAGQGGLAAGAAPYWFDGLHAYPYGFVHAPMLLTYSNGSSTTGGTIVPGTYQYIAVYEWRDASGMLHRSPPSPSKTVVVGAGTNTNTIGLSVITSSLSRKSILGIEENQVHVAIYRTTVGGSTFYRLTFPPQYGMIENAPDAGSVNFIDTKGDADIAGANPARPLSVQPQLYTMTGELADVAPPAFQTVAIHRGRYVGIDASGLTAWLSKVQSEDSGVAAGFNEALTQSFARPKVAIASLDEKGIFFGADDIDVMFGEGPDATGNGEWQMQRLQADVGCVNPKSVVTLPQGVMFESRRGLELLTRELTLAWKGADVRDELEAFPTITSAVLVAAAHEVRFTCVAADGLTGIVLAWDYLHEIWFRRRYRNPSGTDSVPFVDACLISGVYSMLDGTGVVYQETEDHKLDCGTYFVVRDVKLAPMSPSGSPLAWHKVKDVTLLTTSRSDHRLEISAAHDFAEAWDQVETFGEAGYATQVGPTNKCRVQFAYQKCQAVQLRIRDLAPVVLGDGDGPLLESLAFRVDTKRGPVRVAGSEQK